MVTWCCSRGHLLVKKGDVMVQGSSFTVQYNDLRLVIHRQMTVFSTLLSFLLFSCSSPPSVVVVLLSLLVFLSTMSTSQSMSLPYHWLTNTIGNHGSVEEFYNVFNLVDTDYAHFSFADIQEICFIDGMDQWPKLINPKDSIQCTFFLSLFFLPQKSITPHCLKRLKTGSFLCLYRKRTTMQNK